MTDVLDELEAALLGGRTVARSVPTPAMPMSALPEPPSPADDRPLRRPVAVSSIRRCLGAQPAVVRSGRLREVLGADPLTPESRRWYQAADDDRRFADTLSRGSWTTLHSLPIGKSDGDLDHLVVGGFGAVAIMTVDAAEGRLDVVDGALHVDGEPTRDLDRAVEVREDVASRLGVAVGQSVPVASVVVVLGRRGIRMTGRPAVPVVTTRQLHRWLWRLEPRMTATETAELVSVAERASTWRQREAIRSADPREALAFDALDAEVHRARRRRTVWESAGLAVVVTGLAAIATGAPAAIAQVFSAIGG